MKLNPAKCAFGLRSGKFLGYMIIQKGIEVNPDKIRAIQEMKPPTNLNKIQKLVGRIVALAASFLWLEDLPSRATPAHQTIAKQAAIPISSYAQHVMSSMLIKEDDGN
ncbi:UNVERIFIED_CONTAM: hypothetical protein Slati_2783000 [Sesamum latifolium]|uniref:Reverse transcriptase n=1 Tax=Sesamum latifolium TaxID=2727402 RepID=A0AAW2VY37_9LAMI